MNTPDEKKKFVREKFSSISGDYDFLNSLLSFQIDRYWRWVTTRMLSEYSEGNGNPPAAFARGGNLFTIAANRHDPIFSLIGRHCLKTGPQHVFAKINRQNLPSRRLSG